MAPENYSHPAGSWVAFSSEWFCLRATLLFSFRSYPQEANVPTVHISEANTVTLAFFNNLVLIGDVWFWHQHHRIFQCWVSLPMVSRTWSLDESTPKEGRWTPRGLTFRSVPNLSQLASQCKYPWISLGVYFSLTVLLRASLPRRVESRWTPKTFPLNFIFRMTF